MPQSFIFGGDTNETAESLKRRRQLAEALLARSAGRAPRNVGEGLTALGQAIGGRIRLSGINSAQRAGEAGANRNFSGLTGLLTRGTHQPVSVPDFAGGGGSDSLSGGGLQGLIQSESGGNFQARNNVPGSGGRGHFGRLQFSRGRLSEASKALGESITPDRFLNDPSLQQRVEQWHFSDIDRFAEQRGITSRFGETVGGVKLTPEAFRAMAHLGGKGGAEKFISSGGRHNPADANGTTLRDYGQRFGGAQAQPTNPDDNQAIAAALQGRQPPVITPTAAPPPIDTSGITTRDLPNGDISVIAPPNSRPTGTPQLPPPGQFLEQQAQLPPPQVEQRVQPPQELPVVQERPLPTVRAEQSLISPPQNGFPSFNPQLPGIQRIDDEDFQGFGGQQSGSTPAIQQGVPANAGSPEVGALDRNAPFPAGPSPAGGGSGRMAAAAAVLSDSFSTPQQRQIAGAIFNQELEASRPQTRAERLAEQKTRLGLKIQQLSIRKGERDLAAGPKQPAGIQEYLFAQQNGFEGSFLDFKKSIKDGVTVNVGQGEVGKIPPGFELFTDPETGARRFQQIPGGPADIKSKQTAAKLAKGGANAQRFGNVVLEDVDRATALIKKGGLRLPVTGFGSETSAGFGGTEALSLRGFIGTIKANVGFDRLRAMREASPTGGALGQVSERELDFLNSTLGNLDQAQDETVLLENLQRVKVIYQEILRKAAAYPNAAEFGFAKTSIDKPPAEMSDEELLESLN